MKENEDVREKQMIREIENGRVKSKYRYLGEIVCECVIERE
jgi:hypothetical protein